MCYQHPLLETTGPVDCLSPSVLMIEGPYEHVYRHSRGIRLHTAELAPTTSGAPSSPPAADTAAAHPQHPISDNAPTHAPLVLCLHSAYGGWFEFKELLQPLADAGFWAVAMDLRGYGLSDKPPVSFGYDVRGIAGDIAGMIHALGRSEAIILGSDTGAIAGRAVAAGYPSRVAGLIALDEPVCGGTQARLRSLGASLNITSLVKKREELLQSLGLLEELEWERTAAQVCSTAAARVKMHRLVSASLPAKWREVECPAPVVGDQELGVGPLAHLSQPQELAQRVRTWWFT